MTINLVLALFAGAVLVLSTFSTLAQRVSLPGPVLALLFGAAGLTAFLGSSGGSEHPATRPATVGSRPAIKTASGPATNAVEPIPGKRETGEPSAVHDTAANSVQRRIPQNSSTETVYFCGAMTKKGTSCTRRVRVKGRCWQHTGQPVASEVQ